MTDTTTESVSPEKGRVHPVIRLLLIAAVTCLVLAIVLSIEFSHSTKITPRIQPGAEAAWTSNPVVLSAGVDSSSERAPAGTVTFTLSSTGAVLCQATAQSKSNWYACTVNVTQLSAGWHDITIHYSGDAGLTQATTHSSFGIFPQRGSRRTRS